MRIRLFMLVALVAAAVGAETRHAAFVLIAHPGTPVARLERAFVAEVFLRRATRWPDDTPIRPVDLGPDAPARSRFSQEILSRSVSSVRSYWQQRIFSGQGLPPPELDGDDAVVSYVLAHSGAIGYVASGTSLRGAIAVDVH